MFPGISALSCGLFMNRILLTYGNIFEACFDLRTGYSIKYVPGRGIKKKTVWFNGAA